MYTGRWRVEMLGGLRVFLPDGQCLSRLQTERSGALLAFLAFHPDRDHSREYLADLLWSDADRDAGRLRLRVALHSLRRLLEPAESVGVHTADLFHSSRLILGINPLAPLETDVGELLAALTAGETGDPTARATVARLYVGDLLPGLTDDWVLPERERLASRTRSILEQPVAPVSSKRGWSAPAPRLLGVLTDAPPFLPFFLRLPPHLTRFFGRETEIATLREWLSLPALPPRLITLIGPGGCGKTRLALEATEQIAAAYAPDGIVVFVPLADLADPETISDEIARRLELPARSRGQEALTQVVQALHDHPALLILDNLEHLLGGAVEIAQALLERLPNLTLLVTSQQRLALEGESVLSVPPLPLPTDDLSFDTVRTNPAVRLFADRARAVRPDFTVTPRGASAVAALCTRLEGIPLALELTAAWASLLTPSQMLLHLEGAPSPVQDRLLSSRSRDRALRHQTLDAALGWSVERLPEPLLRFWAGLSVFRGECTLEAAEAVCGGSALDSLAALQERSLVQAVRPVAEAEHDAPLRFRMLEPLRQYAARLLSPGDEIALRDRHLACFLTAATEESDGTKSADPTGRLRHLDADYSNVNAALEWGMRGSGGDESVFPRRLLALKLAAALWEYWLIRGRLREGRTLLTEALSATADRVGEEPQAPIDVWNGLGAIEQAMGDLGAARTAYDNALRLCTVAGDRLRTAAVMSNQGVVAEIEGRFEDALRWHQDALNLRREIGDRRGEASSLNNLGVAFQYQQQYEEARWYFRQSLEIKREMGEMRPLAQAYNNLGIIAHILGDNAEAEYYQRQALSLRRDIGDRPGIAASLNNLGRVAESMGHFPQAREWYLESLAIKVEIGDTPGQARTEYNLAVLALHTEDISEARRHVEECLTLIRRAAPTPNRQDMAFPLHLLMRLLAFPGGDPVRAAWLCGACDGLLEAAASRRQPVEQKEYEEARTTVAQSIGEKRFSETYRRGSEALVEQVLRVALREQGV